MNRRGIAAAVACTAVTLAAPRGPAADDAADAKALVAEGEALAKQGEYSRAIDRFKQSDRLEPHARNACLIGLAYTRRELWPQAEIFLAQCRQRATAADPAPDWLGDAERQLAQKLREVDVAAVEVHVEPAAAATSATITVSSFAPDERFAPRTIHLPPGNHQLTASAPGYPDAHETITVTGRGAQRVVLRLDRPAAVPAGVVAAARPAVVSPQSRRSRWLFVGAAGVAAIGGGFHVLAYRERSQLVDAHDRNDPALYQAHEGRFDTFRAVTLGCYGVAVVAAGVGVVLGLGEGQERATIGAAPTRGGALVLVEWRP